MVAYPFPGASLTLFSTFPTNYDGYYRRPIPTQTAVPPAWLPCCLYLGHRLFLCHQRESSESDERGGKGGFLRGSTRHVNACCLDVDGQGKSSWRSVMFLASRTVLKRNSLRSPRGCSDHSLSFVSCFNFLSTVAQDQRVVPSARKFFTSGCISHCDVIHL